MNKKPCIVLGSGNRHKGIEMAELLAETGISLKTLADFNNIEEVVEDGKTFMENAEKKAIGYAKQLLKWTIAEDSGLSVPALNGAPGIYSARFSDPDATDERNNLLLLEKMKDVPLENRSAYYSCAMVLADPQGNIRFQTEGRCYGRILYQPEGYNGFGYDPLFEVLEYRQSFGILDSKIKQSISHRAQATKQLIPVLHKLIAQNEIQVN